MLSFTNEIETVKVEFVNECLKEKLKIQNHSPLETGQNNLITLWHDGLHRAWVLGLTDLLSQSNSAMHLWLWDPLEVSSPKRLYRGFVEAKWDNVGRIAGTKWVPSKRSPCPTSQLKAGSKIFSVQEHKAISTDNKQLPFHPKLSPVFFCDINHRPQDACPTVSFHSFHTCSPTTILLYFWGLEQENGCLRELKKKKKTGKKTTYNGGKEWN